MTSQITKRQGEFLAFILRYTQKYGLPPSYEDMATQFGISSPSVNGMMKTLERNGYITRRPGAARSVRVEVRPEDLPGSDFAPSRRKRSTSDTPKAPETQGTVVSVAIAMLDTLMPSVVRSAATDDEVVRVVLEAAKRVGQELEKAGVSSAEALSASHQIAAEVSRWRPSGRGVTVPHRIWVKR